MIVEMDNGGYVGEHFEECWQKNCGCVGGHFEDLLKRIIVGMLVDALNTS